MVLKRNKNMNTAAELLADKISSGFSMEGTDWIPEGATEPAVIEEVAEAEIAPDETLKEQLFSMFRHNKLALVSAIIILLYICLLYTSRCV